MQVRQIMSAPVVTVDEDTPLDEIAARLIGNEINGVPVVDRAGRLVGFVSEGDVLALTAESDESPRPSVPNGHPRTAAEIMNRDVITVASDLSIAATAQMLQRYEIRQVPVVSADGRLVGIVARRDVLRRYAESSHAPGTIEDDVEC